MNLTNNNDTICALATGGGMSAIALIRLSGIDSIKIANKIFSKELQNKKSHTVHFGTILEGTKIIDEVVLTIFYKDHSFTAVSYTHLRAHET